MSDQCVPHLTVSAPDLRDDVILPVQNRPDVASWKRRSSALTPSSPTDPSLQVPRRLRSFSVTGKGIVCHGDHQIVVPQLYVSSETVYRVLIVGSAGVGKTSLVNQFSSSDCLSIQESLDDSPEKVVSLLVDGVESRLLCIDCPASSSLDDECLSTADAIVVVYSVTDRSTYHYATRILTTLSSISVHPSKTVIVVGNKVDLVRGRIISSEEGRSLANTYDTKYVETSSILNHNVDELLVGIVSQIRLKAKQSVTRRGSWTSSGLVTKARDIVGRLMQKCDLKARSCDDLNVI